MLACQVFRFAFVGCCSGLPDMGNFAQSSDNLNFSFSGPANRFFRSGKAVGTGLNTFTLPTTGLQIRAKTEQIRPTD